MSNSNYITVPENDIEVLPSRKETELSGFYSSIVDLITFGNRGKALTWTLNGLDYSTDPQALTAAYDANSAAIDAYLEYVDVDKLVKAMLQGGNKKKANDSWSSQSIMGGIAMGAIGFWLIKKII